MKNFAIVLAAGKGTRMKTELPKCAFPILKKPMIEYIIENI
jgi:bifunctional UDP-N-acetylglucosamine pyrophosphorylase/glucosamine-1-phosphate N-acetyltransferase